MELKNYFPQDKEGNVLPGATCRLYLAGTQTLASGLEDARGVAMNNPFTADSNGLVQFAAPNGRYDLEVTHGGRSLAITVQCLDATESISVIAEEADRAETAADAAEAASNAAFVNADVYPDVATGRAAVADGEQFQVVEGEEIVRYRKASDTVATEVARFPSSASVLNPIYSSASVNAFDESAVLVGYELRADMDAPTPHPESIVSDLIPVRGWNYLTVQGLPVPATYARQYAFLGRDGQTIVHRGYFGKDVAGATIAVPDSAFFFMFTVSQRNGADQDNSAIQVESGAIASDYVSYEKGLIVGLGSRLLDEPEQVHLSYKGTKNLFDKTSIVTGFEVYSDGGIFAQSDSTYVAIDIRDVESTHLTVSGLPTYSDGLSARRYAFYGSDSITADNTVGTGTIPRTDDTATIAIPEGAAWFALSIIQRSTSSVDYDIIQIEAGAESTPYAPYQPQVTRINNIPLAAGRDADSGSYSGGVSFGFGDSITETTNVDSGDYLYPTGYRGNWPDFAIPKIQPDSYYSFAKSGASFASRPDTSGFQHFAHQITVAAGYAELNNLTPRWAIVSLGTNDGSGLIQDFDVVMGKELYFDPDGTPVTTLDSTKSLEAARLGFARLRWHFPQTVMFYALPLQRVSHDRVDQIARFELVTKVARCYGFEVIDCFGESGIVQEFEVSGGEGRDLYDGLHTNPSGRKKQGDLIAAKIMARLA